MCTGVTVFLNNFVSVTYLQTDEFGMQPFWWRCVYLPLAMHVQTTTLFTGFIFSESNLVACGQGYKYTIGEKEKKVEDFNTIRQVDVWKVETSTATLPSTENWNM